MVEQEVTKSQRAQLTDLTKTLRELEDCYRSLLGTLRIRKEQVRRGELKVLHEGMEDERARLQKIAELDARRNQLVLELLGMSEGETAGTLVSLEAVMPLAVGDAAEELSLARSALRTMLEAVQAEYAVLQQVGEALFTHVTSVIQRLRSLGTNAAVYGRNGRVNDRRSIVSGVDFHT